jgi:plasmid stability protein
MSKTIQIRGIPDEVHAVLRARAAKAGMSLSAFVLMELRGLAVRPTREEFLKRLARRKPAELRVSAAQIVRKMRGPLRPR